MTFSRSVCVRSTLLGSLSAVLLSCGGYAANTRPVTLTSRVVAVDQAFERARQNAFERNPTALAEAERELRGILERHPNDPLLPVVRVLLARVLVAEDKLNEARRALLFDDAHVDPDITVRKELVNAVLDVRTAERAENTRDHSALLARAYARLTPLLGTRPDTAETVELSCAMAECAMQQPPNQAIQLLARVLAPVEQAELRGTPWVRTGLRCETATSREGLVRALAERVTEPDALTDAIDQSREGSVLRRYLAERLLVLIADRPQETSRYMQWLADLPDDRATQRSSANTSQNTIVLGVLAPMSGPRASVATSLLRGAQLAIDTIGTVQRVNVRIVLEDEGDSPTQISAAIERLFRQGVRSVIGPTRADFAPSAAIAAQSMGVNLYLPNAAPGVEQTGTLVQRVGANFDERASLLASSMAHVGHSARVTVLTSTLTELLADRCEDGLQERAVAYQRMTWDGPTLHQSFGNPVLVAGIFGAEARASIAEHSARSRFLWVIDALAARGDRVETSSAHHERSDHSEHGSTPSRSDLRSVGVWVGLRAGVGFAPMLQRFCARNEESPDEFALMAHDATVRAALGGAGAAVLGPLLALDPSLVLVGAQIRANLQWNDSMPAAAARCP